MCSADVFDKLVRALGDMAVTCREDASFAELTTLGTGGKIRLAVFPDDLRKTVRTLRLIDKLAVPRVVLGKGSNVLANDGFFDGVAVVMSATGVKTHGRSATVLAGTSTVYLSKVLREKGLCGGEFFACLPATVGGSVVGNAGCFGQNVQSVLRSVTVYKNGKIVHMGAKKCDFSKRNSVFRRHPDWVVLAARFTFEVGDPQQVESNILRMRRSKALSQPLEFRSAGCVVYHESVALSKLIDQAGLKGYAVGGAQISTKHAGFVLNIDKATSLDIYLIIQHIKETLWDKYGICAKTELCLVGWKDDDDFAKRQE